MINAAPAMIRTPEWSLAIMRGFGMVKGILQYTQSAHGDYRRIVTMPEGRSPAYPACSQMVIPKGLN